MNKKQDQLLHLMNEALLYMQSYREKWRDMRNIFLCNMIDDMLFTHKLIERHEHELLYGYLKANRPRAVLHDLIYTDRHQNFVGCVWFGNFEDIAQANQYRIDFWKYLMKFVEDDERFENSKFPKKYEYGSAK